MIPTTRGRSWTERKAHIEGIEIRNGNIFLRALKWGEERKRSRPLGCNKPHIVLLHLEDSKSHKLLEGKIRSTRKRWPNLRIEIPRRHKESNQLEASCDACDQTNLGGSIEKNGCSRNIRINANQKQPFQELDYHSKMKRLENRDIKLNQIGKGQVQLPGADPQEAKTKFWSRGDLNTHQNLQRMNAA